MRSRSNSGVRLDKLMHLAYNTVLNRMDPVTGLFRSNYPGFENHAWIRDNVYAIHCVWGLALAYRKNADFDEDVAKVYELQQSCVKVMRSLLYCMMRQVEKIEKFKRSQDPGDSLHAKYSARTLGTVVGDQQWGHLQIDAVSLYLLTLAQMTASGIQIIYNLDEVAFIQNLVFYIEKAYRIPDFGVWERGDKTNHGLPELNASSIGMAKAALAALNDLDLFGAHGSKASVIHVLADEMQQCYAILESLLPRESYSKETDGALLSIISYPAFAVEDPMLISITRSTIIQKLRGRYGCKRFMRDGYKTPLEDPHRQYYEPVELQRFENIESEWPLFFCFLILDGLFWENHSQVAEYRDMLEEVLIKGEQGLRYVPELFIVPRDKAELEYLNPGSQERQASGSMPYLWAQSLYILVELIDQGFIRAAELDPLNRRFATEKKPDTVVQVVVLAENTEVKDRLAAQKLYVQTVEEVKPFTVLPASVLGKLYAQLGRNEKMKLTGRPSGEVGLLSTSKLYSIDDRFFVFTPQTEAKFYAAYFWSCEPLWTEMLEKELDHLRKTWKCLGRPVLIVYVPNAFLRAATSWEVRRTGEKDDVAVPMGLIGTLKKIKSGYLSGTRVVMGQLEDFLTTSCITSLDFLSQTDVETVDDETKNILDEIFFRNKTFKDTGFLPGSGSRPAQKRLESSAISRGKVSVLRNMATRHRSIMLDANDSDFGPGSRQFSLDLQRLRLRYSQSTTPRRKQSEGSDVSMDRRESVSSYGIRGTTPDISPPPELTVQMSSGELTPTTPDPGLQEELEKKMGSRLQLLKTGEQEGSDMPKVSSRLQLETLEDLSCFDLVEMLSETESIEEQGDLVYCLWQKQGLDWDTCIGGREGTSVRKLVEELYIKACQSHTWWLVRLCAGLLEKRVEDLSNAVTDLLVRQKQITVGMPAIKEENISRPLPPEILQGIIKKSFGQDINSVVLTQEIIVYLGMFIRTEPQLFREMLRLRVGLIIQVMTSELARALHKNVDEASEHLLNVSPFEMKTLLYHILSGKEVEEVEDKEELDKFLAHGDYVGKEERTGMLQLRKKIEAKKSMQPRKKVLDHDEVDAAEQDESSGDEEDSSPGQWVRRRRIDGALNRVPPDFYSKIWKILRECEAGISLEGNVLEHNLTKEMTTEEIKFAVKVESFLNLVPDPEYRQLLVEALMVLTIVTENQTNAKLSRMGTVNVERIVHKANEIFIQDQREANGDAVSCCAGEPRIYCGGVCGICRFFYDMPPSGRYGTITYMLRAVACLVPHDGEDIECAVQ